MKEMSILLFIYLVFMFIGLYLLIFFLLLYAKNKKELFNYPKLKKKVGLSIVIPAYNLGEEIVNTLKEILKTNYPKNLLDIIVVNDGSIDNTLKLAKNFSLKYKNIRVFDKKHSGKADSLNFGFKRAKHELTAVIDGDSYPTKEAFSRMLGYFEDEKIGVITSTILVRNSDRFFSRLQAIEYALIAWTRRLLGYVDCVYVSPGPLSIYRRNIVLKLGGFDTKNLTEDIEITWRLLHKGYKTRMSLAARTYTKAPTSIIQWWKQRLRWDIGGIQTIKKYKHTFLRLKYNMVGLFVLPFFVVSLFLGLMGFLIFAYLLITRIQTYYLIAGYSLMSQTQLTGFYFTPSVLNFFGLAMLVFGVIFVSLGLKTIKPPKINSKNFLSVAVYLLVYLSLYPIIMVHALTRIARKKVVW